MAKSPNDERPTVTITNARTIQLLDQLGEAWNGESRTRVIDRLAEREIARMANDLATTPSTATTSPD